MKLFVCFDITDNYNAGWFPLVKLCPLLQVRTGTEKIIALTGYWFHILGVDW